MEQEKRIRMLGVKFNLNNPEDKLIYNTLKMCCNKQKATKKALVNFFDIDLAECYKPGLK